MLLLYIAIGVWLFVIFVLGLFWIGRTPPLDEHEIQWPIGAPRYVPPAKPKRKWRDNTSF